MVVSLQSVISCDFEYLLRYSAVFADSDAVYGSLDDMSTFAGGRCSVLFLHTMPTNLSAASVFPVEFGHPHSGLCVKVGKYLGATLFSKCFYGKVFPWTANGSRGHLGAVFPKAAAQLH